MKGEEIGIRIDQTLTQDSTGTMAYMQLEAMEVPRVKTKRSLAYIDHNMLQEGPETWMITDTFRPWRKSTVLSFQDRATVSVIR